MSRAANRIVRLRSRRHCTCVGGTLHLEVLRDGPLTTRLHPRLGRGRRRRPRRPGGTRRRPRSPLAAAAELRIKDAKTYPSICPYCSVGCATLVHTVDGRSPTSRAIAQPAQRGHALPQGRRHLPAALNPNGRTERSCTARPAPRSGRCGNSSGPWPGWVELVKKSRDETFIEQLESGARVQHDAGHLLAGRRHARQRVEPHPSRSSCAASASSRSRPGQI